MSLDDHRFSRGCMGRFAALRVQLLTLLVNGRLILAKLLLLLGLRLKQFAARGRVLLNQIVGGRGDFPALTSNLLGLPRLLLVGPQEFKMDLEGLFRRCLLPGLLPRDASRLKKVPISTGCYGWQARTPAGRAEV